MNNQGAILRVSKEVDPYTRVNNEAINDARLSWGARGLLIYLLSKPDNWSISVVDLIKKSPAGEHAVRSLMKELTCFGYIKRTRHRSSEGTFHWESLVREKPDLNEIQ